jgi:hypothetical protein
MNPLTGLVGKKGKYSKRLILTQNQFIMEWDARSNKGRKGWNFDPLSADIGFSVERPKAFKEGIIGRVAVLIISEY